MPAVEIRDWKRKKALQQIRVKHRSECGRKKILREDFGACVFERSDVWLGQQSFKDGYAEAAARYAIDRKQMRSKVRIFVLNFAEHCHGPVCCPDSAALRGDDVKWMRFAASLIFNQDIPVIERL